MNKKNGAKKTALFCVLLILVLVILYSGLRVLESTVFSPVQEEQTEVHNSKTITRDGVAYFPRQDITVLMIMGVDQTGPMVSSEYHRNPGACDVVMLAVFDEKAEEYSIFYLNRDTMLTMPVLGLGGKQAGTTYGQLALSHSYGTGMEDSCENVRKTVSDFLYGLHIDHYLSMNMDAIGILNDAVGGVSVTVTDDFSEADPTIHMGEMKLNHQQAINFIRTRRGVGDELNLSRIERQKEYMTSFAETLSARAQEDESFLVDAFDQIGPYSVTDCTVNSLSSLVERFGSFTLKEIVTPAGENTKGEEYMEFYVDEEALDALILEYFYAPKK